VAQAGDKTERWRASYSRVRKDALSDPQSTNRARLSLLGFDSLPRSKRVLDVGTGDGNLFTTMLDMGFTQIWGLEYQPELLASHPGRNRVAVASLCAQRDSPGSRARGPAVPVRAGEHLDKEGAYPCADEFAQPPFRVCAGQTGDGGAGARNPRALARLREHGCRAGRSRRISSGVVSPLLAPPLRSLSFGLKRQARCIFLTGFFRTAWP